MQTSQIIECMETMLEVTKDFRTITQALDTEMGTFKRFDPRYYGTLLDDIVTVSSMLILPARTIMLLNNCLIIAPKSYDKYNTSHHALSA